MLDKEGNAIVITEDNAAEIARRERELEAEGKDPEKEIFDPEAKKDIELKKEEDDEGKKEIKDKEPPEAIEKTDEEIMSADPETLSDEEKQRKEDILKAEDAEIERLTTAKEEDLSDEDKEKRKDALLKLDTKQKAEFDKKINDYAKTKGIEPEDARRILTSAKKIIEKYRGNPEEIAIANLSLQQLISKKDEEIQAVRDEAANQPYRPRSAAEWRTVIKERGLQRTDGQVVSWETIVNDYREKYKSETEEMSDEQVLGLVAKDIHLRAESHAKEQKLQMREKANEKREKLLVSLPEDSKQFSSDIKEVLKTVPDAVILNKDYTADAAIFWARGRYFTPERIAEMEAAAEKKGFERGQATKKIISGPVGGGKPPKSRSEVMDWTDAEKDQAYEMFPGVEDEKELYKLWADIKKSRQENKKK